MPVVLALWKKGMAMKELGRWRYAEAWPDKPAGPRRVDTAGTEAVVGSATVAVVEAEAVAGSADIAGDADTASIAHTVGNVDNAGMGHGVLHEVMAVLALALVPWRGSTQRLAEVDTEADVQADMQAGVGTHGHVGV